MMLFMANAAVGADQLDAVALDAVDGAEMHAVGADHFHMLANVFEAAHAHLLAVCSRSNASPAAEDARRAARLRLFGARVIGELRVVRAGVRA